MVKILHGRLNLLLGGRSCHWLRVLAIIPKKQESMAALAGQTKVVVEIISDVV